jgi:dUTPase
MVVIQYQNSSKVNQLDKDNNVFNLYANENFKIKPNEISEISTGVSILIPNDIEVKFLEILHPIRGVYLINDSFVSDGNWKQINITLKNKHPSENFIVKEGMKIAQLRITKLKNPVLERV